MKKQILIIAIVLILVVIGLSGCTEEPKEESDDKDTKPDDSDDDGDLVTEGSIEFLACDCDQSDKVPPISVQDGYTASYFITPNDLTSPSDVVVDSDGSIYVIEVRGHGVSKISSNDDVQFLAELQGSFYSISVYQDTFYCYDFPRGEVVKITKNGDVTSLVFDADKLQCFSESTIAVNNIGEIFIVRNNEATGQTSHRVLES